MHHYWCDGWKSVCRFCNVGAFDCVTTQIRTTTTSTTTKNAQAKQQKKMEIMLVQDVEVVQGFFSMELSKTIQMHVVGLFIFPPPFSPTSPPAHTRTTQNATTSKRMTTSLQFTVVTIQPIRLMRMLRTRITALKSP